MPLSSHTWHICPTCSSTVTQTQYNDQGLQCAAACLPCFGKFSGRDERTERENVKLTSFPRLMEVHEGVERMGKESLSRDLERAVAGFGFGGSRKERGNRRRDSVASDSMEGVTAIRE